MIIILVMDIIGRNEVGLYRDYWIKKGFVDKIAVGVDCRKRYICTKGWLEESNVHYIFLQKNGEYRN